MRRSRIDRIRRITVRIPALCEVLEPRLLLSALPAAVATAVPMFHVFSPLALATLTDERLIAGGAVQSVSLGRAVHPYTVSPDATFFAPAFAMTDFRGPLPAGDESPTPGNTDAPTNALSGDDSAGSFVNAAGVSAVGHGGSPAAIATLTTLTFPAPATLTVNQPLHITPIESPIIAAIESIFTTQESSLSSSAKASARMPGSADSTARLAIVEDIGGPQSIGAAASNNQEPLADGDVSPTGEMRQVPTEHSNLANDKLKLGAGSEDGAAARIAAQSSDQLFAKAGALSLRNFGLASLVMLCLCMNPRMRKRQDEIPNLLESGK